MKTTHLVPPPASHRWFMSRLTLACRAVLKHPGRRPRAAVLVLAAAALVAGCGSSGGNFSAKSFAPVTAVVSFPSGQPGHGKPAVTLGSKNFTEALILGQLYAQALAAEGFTVHLKQNIGPTEVIDPGLLNHSIDMYPEYIGEIITTLTNIALGAPGTAGSNVAPAPPDSWQQAYGLGNLQFMPMTPGNPVYAAVDSGQIQVAGVFTTDPQLRSGKYVVLSDPKNIFGYQNVAPVVNKGMLKALGPAFAQTLNAVSSHLTLAVMQQLNAEVVLGHQSPAAAARQFLASQMSG